MPLSTQHGVGEGLGGEAFLGGKQTFGTQLLLQPQRHISTLLCIPVIISAGEAQRCCSSFCSIQTSPRQADGFIHGNLTWRLFCALKDGGGTRIQMWIFSISTLKWESRAGLLSSVYSSKTYHSCKLHTQYLQPSQLLLSPSSELGCAC